MTSCARLKSLCSPASRLAIADGSTRALAQRHCASRAPYRSSSAASTACRTAARSPVRLASAKESPARNDCASPSPARSMPSATGDSLSGRCSARTGGRVTVIGRCLGIPTCPVARTVDLNDLGREAQLDIAARRASDGYSSSMASVSTALRLAMNSRMASSAAGSMPGSWYSASIFFQTALARCSAVRLPSIDHCSYEE